MEHLLYYLQLAVRRKFATHDGSWVQGHTKLTMMAFLLTTASFAQVSSTQLPLDDAIRVAEFYRLAAQFQDQLWEG